MTHEHEQEKDHAHDADGKRPHRHRTRPASMPALVVLAATLLAVGACSSDPAGPGGPEQVTDVAVIQPGTSADVTVTVPDTVDAGVPFTVSVETYGNGCAAKGPTETSQSGSEARVEPFDIYTRGETVVCPDVLLTFVHEATLAFPTAGTIAQVTFVGRRLPDDAPVTVTREVQVR